MQIIRVDRMVQLAGLKCVLRPRTRYVVSDWESQQYLRQENIKRQTGREDIFTDIGISSFNPYERRYAGQDADSRTIAIYRHDAIGDALIATSIPRYIKTLYPGATLDFYCHPNMWRFHLGNQFLHAQMAIPIPIPLDACRNFYDWHIFYEGMLENNSEPDQNNCYDDMFGFCGVNPPDIYKRPYLSIRPDDYGAVRHWKDDPKGKWDPDKNYIVYHLSPANENRCYPLIYTRRFWELFCANFTDYKIYVVGLDDDGRRKPMFDGLPEDRVINMLSKIKNFRQHVPLLERAKLVICPDSAIGHLAACFPNVPVISLWGVFHPDDRVKYYGNHYPMHDFNVCKWAPCRDHHFEIPMRKCRTGGHWDTIRGKYNDMCNKRGAVHNAETLDGWCAAMASIEPEAILKLADELLSGHRTPEHIRVEEAPEAQPLKITKDDYDHKARLIPDAN